jgi:hypothetical protein
MGKHIWDTEKQPIVTVSEKTDDFPGSSSCVLPSFEETFGLIAPIVEFNEHGRPACNSSHPQLKDLLVEGASPSEVLRKHEGKNLHQPGAFRWIHVPVTKMDWAQVIRRSEPVNFADCLSESGGECFERA